MTKLTNSDKCDKIIEIVTDLKHKIKKIEKENEKNKEKKKKLENQLSIVEDIYYTIITK